jgi:hypothetical protein
VAQDNRPALRGIQADKLVGQDRPTSPGFLDHLIAGVGFQSSYKPNAVLVQLIQPGIIQVGPVKDQQNTQLKAQILDGLAVMGLIIGDQDALGQQPGENGVQLDSPLAGPKLGPGKDRGAEVNGGGLDDFDWRSFLGLRGQFGGEPLIQFIIGLFRR